MKKLMLVGLFLIVGLFFMTGCQTNNFCNIDRPTLAASAEIALREELTDDYNSASPSKEAKKYATLDEYLTAKVTESAILKKSKSLYKACITNENLDANSEPTDGEAIIKTKTWLDALKQGPLELLFVFPVSMLIIGLTAFLGGSNIAKLFGIILATFTVRLIVIGLTWKATKSQYKMQELQPEIAKVQAKYYGLTDQQSKMKMSQELMKVYSKHGVNPLGSMLTQFLTMPILLAMWGAVQETSMLHVGSVAGVVLGTTTSHYIINDFQIFALITFILMAALQLITMKLPTFLQARERKRKNQVMDPKAAAQMKQTNMIMNIMIVFVIFMGWTLPFAMSIYWIASSLFSIGQTLLLKKFLGGRRYEKVSG